MRETSVCPEHAVASRVGSGGPLGWVLSAAGMQAAVAGLVLNNCEGSAVLIRGGG